MAYSKTEHEIGELWTMARGLIARLSDDYWEIKKICSFGGLREYLAKKPLVNLFIYDICDRESLEFLPEVRRDYPQAPIMLLADGSVSPMEYIKPGLKVSSLLLKPWTARQAREVLYGFLGEYIELSQSGPDRGQGFYVAETKGGRLSIPYGQIYFFEAREKKIYVCAGREEYSFYSTVDRLAEELPEYFLRCHRGVIVNRHKIKKVMLSRNTILLNDGFTVPLSRSYKAAIKGIR